MNSCVTKSKAPNSDFLDMEDILDFKVALRVLRGAMAFIHPWNRSVDAIESFFVQNNFWASDISSTEKTGPSAQPVLRLRAGGERVQVEGHGAIP